MCVRVLYFVCVRDSIWPNLILSKSSYLDITDTDTDTDTAVQNRAAQIE